MTAQELFSDLRYRPDGIPILSYERMDELTEKLVKAIMPENFTEQVDATDLKRLFAALDGWHYGGRYLSQSGGLLGLAAFYDGEVLVYDENRKKTSALSVKKHTILVDRGLYQKRLERVFRFTFAHETGHALLHEKFCSNLENMKKYADQEKDWIIKDTKDELSKTDGNRLQTERDWLEWQANAFASAVLMPKSLVMKVAEMVRDERMDSFWHLNELKDTLCDVFKVSGTAAFYRMKRLGLAGEACVMKNQTIVESF